MATDNSKIKVLNAFAGAAINTKLWDRSVFEITHVEHDPNIAAIIKIWYPEDEVITCDGNCNRNEDGELIIRDNCPGNAMYFILKYFKDYKIIWVSPPCQSHSIFMRTAGSEVRHGVMELRYPEMSLYKIIIVFTHFYDGIWIVENVKPYYKPLIKPSVKLGRHYFWTNMTVSIGKKYPSINIPKASANQLEDYHGVKIPEETNGFDKRQVLRNGVYPEISIDLIDIALEYLAGKKLTEQQSVEAYYS